MPRKRKILITTICVSITLIVTSCALLLNNPEFGQLPSEQQMEEYARSPQYNGDTFENPVVTTMDIKLSTTISLLWKNIKGIPRAIPNNLLPVKQRREYQSEKKDAFITWFGHSAVLLELEGQTIFFDPMLGIAPAPYKFLISSRFNPQLPTPIEKLPLIDAVVISHDHYDHLDYESVLKLKEKVKHWFVPLGVNIHLQKWGIDKEKITVLDWHESAYMPSGVQLTCTPARHFSGRGFKDRNMTLWSSWVVKTKTKNIFFSGDGGYWKGFKEIGNEYGPFDFAMVECGQYNENWNAIHMFPEQSVQALVDLKATVGMPIHWGAFKLSLHAWDDSPKRFAIAAQAQKMKYITPIIGEKISINQEVKPHHWWEEYD